MIVLVLCKNVKWWKIYDFVSVISVQHYHYGYPFGRIVLIICGYCSPIKDYISV